MSGGINLIHVDPNIYALGKIFTWFIFFYVFKSIYHPQKFYPLFILYILSILCDIFTPYAYLVVAILLFLTFYWEKRSKIFLLNTILLSSLVRLISQTIANFAIIVFFTNNVSTETMQGSLSLVITANLIQAFISLLFIYLYRRFNIATIWNIEKSLLFSLLIGYLFAVIFIFMQIIQHYQAYSDLTSGIMLFILIQCTFIVIIFLKGNQGQKEAYTRELTKEQLKNLKMYTDQLEHDQIKLRHFEHNYKNTISNLRTIAQEKNYPKMKSSLNTLENYSDSYFDNISMQLFKDLNNVKNPYLKSLLISKLTLINQNNIICHFECRDSIDDILINIFDLVRLLGISFDNAIEATKNQKNGEIQVAIIEEKKQLSFIINNTTTIKTDINEIMEEGFTTKKHHSGLGLVNIQDIKKKYPNLFVQYRNNESWFKLNIVIIK